MPLSRKLLTFQTPLDKTDGEISLPAATDSQDGYLTKEDHVSFAAASAVTSVNDESGVVVLTAEDIDTDVSGTSIQAALDAISGGDVTSVNGEVGVVVLTADDLDTDVSGTTIQEALDALEINSHAPGSDDQDLSGLALKTYEVNGHALSGNVEVVASDVNTEASGVSVQTHIDDTSNPHSVVASDVSLGNCDDTADADKPISSATQTALDAKVDENGAITAATKTKITYDVKGLVTSGADATTADIADSSDKRYCTDDQKTVIGNTSGTNTGDQTASTVDTDASGVTVQESLDLKLESETDPIVGAITGIVKANGAGVISAASAGTDYQAPLTAGTDYLAPAGNGVNLTNVLHDVVDDTSPTLGGELDAGAHSIGFTEQDLTGDGTTTISWTLGNKCYFTFGSQGETITMTPPTKSGNLLLILKQDGTGSRTVTWSVASGYSIVWPSATAPTLTTDGGAEDIIAFYYSKKTDTFYGTSSLDFGEVT